MSDPIQQLKIRSLSQAPVGQNQRQVPNQDFQSLLEERIRSNSSIEFSKHALKRVGERDIDLSLTQLERLNQGVALASAKGLHDPLILVDQTAFVVNVPNNKVITTLHEDALKGNVFTNIDGAVIV